MPQRHQKPQRTPQRTATPPRTPNSRPQLRVQCPTCRPPRDIATTSPPSPRATTTAGQEVSVFPSGRMKPFSPHDEADGRKTRPQRHTVMVPARCGRWRNRPNQLARLCRLRLGPGLAEPETAFPGPTDPAHKKARGAAGDRRVVLPRPIVLVGLGRPDAEGTRSAPRNHLSHAKKRLSDTGKHLSDAASRHET